MESSDFSSKQDFKEIIRRRRARQMALAIIRRARDAGIKEEYIRIKQDSFASVLDPDFHGGKKIGVNVFSDNIYKNPDFLLKRDFITIDGGDNYSRYKAGFAILFRMIAYDKMGKHFDCNSLKHKFQTINSTEEITRNDLAEELKSYDLLMISEFCKRDFLPHFETGSFFDEVFSERVIRGRPTIITFSDPIISNIKDKEVAAANGDFDSGCGRQLALLNVIPQTTDKVLRVRVKKT